MTDDSGYLAVTIGGVQEFIAASRRTADLWAGSRIMSRLCQVAVESVQRAGGTPVIPESAAVESALPNRVSVAVPAGSVQDTGTAMLVLESAPAELTASSVWSESRQESTRRSGCLGRYLSSRLARHRL